jgi:hypothetical protein
LKKADMADPEMRAEYDFSGGVCGKYAGRMAAGSNVVLLDADVAKEFPNSESVNEALRALLPVIQKHSEKARSSKKSPAAS